ncbi:MAG: NifB/NifX family molybdenum-iron cluster-binding protein [Caldisericia bacterium]|nr:NifB/NifX family molybdenum-iron cluster-binding protein [Caldisericia bacterium]
MKIAFCIQEDKGKESILDSRFGRSPGFLIYNTEEDEAKYITNKQNLNAAQGAGVQSAQNIVNEKVDVLITRNCGPKSFSILLEAGVEVYLSKDSSVQIALDKFNKNELTKSGNSNVEGHW